MKVDSGFIANGKANLYYEAAGQGQPIVLIHAGVADSRQWNNEFVSFASDFRVIRYDMRGYGRSAPVDEEFSHIEDLTSLLDQLGYRQPIVLVGCSMGGGLAMDFALMHPSRVKTLVMVGSGPSGLTLDVPGHPKQAEAAEAYKAGNLDLLAELEAQIWFDGMGRTAEQVDRKMRALALEMNRLALAHDAKQLGKRLADVEIPAAERLDQIQIPLLVIVGEHDEPYSHAAADHMIESIPHAHKVTLPDAAHLANMDQPEEFESALRSFLEQVF
jgi:pimeloyl-ACP methyl ester carboxylesterase